MLNFAKCIFLISESTDFPFHRVLLCSNYRENSVHLSFASPWVDPRDIPDNPLEARGNGTVLVFLFCLLTLLDHGDLPTGFLGWRQCDKQG